MPGHRRQAGAEGRHDARDRRSRVARREAGSHALERGRIVAELDDEREADRRRIVGILDGIERGDGCRGLRLRPRAVHSAERCGAGARLAREPRRARRVELSVALEQYGKGEVAVRRRRLCRGAPDHGRELRRTGVGQAAIEVTAGPSLGRPPRGPGRPLGAELRG